MTSVHLYQAEKKDIQDLHDLLKEYKEKDLTDLKFPEVDTVKLNQYLNNFLKVGKIICIKDLDRDKIVYGVDTFPNEAINSSLKELLKQPFQKYKKPTNSADLVK